MPKRKSKKPAQSESEDEEDEQVIFVTERLRKEDLKADEIIVRLPFPKESKWPNDELGISSKGKGKVGGVEFSHFGQAKKTKIDKKVQEAIKLNQLQVVIGRIGNRIGV